MTTTPNAVMVMAAVMVALFLLRPRMAGAPLWRATVTPLASIIGSGFLVAGPILAHVAGNWAWVAMVILCAIAYLFGAVIRHNIAVVEPMMEDGPPRTIALLEHISEYALAFAYFVSVSYYLNLFASFALRADDIIDPALARWVATGVIAALGLIGALRGLRGLEHVEVAAVGLKLALIAGLLSMLVYTAVMALSGAGLNLPTEAHDTGLYEARVFLGLIILVQGFETSRFLGDTYDRATRIRTMRWAQWLSTAIYVVFILLVTPYFPETLPKQGGETQIIDILAPLATMVAPLLIFAALASQLSAAVADMNGAGGLLETASRRHVPVKIGYAITACIAIGVTWETDIFGIIVYASKAFVIYYGLQSLTALLAALRGDGPRKVLRVTAFGLALLIALLVVLFGISVE